MSATIWPQPELHKDWKTWAWELTKHLQKVLTGNSKLGLGKLAVDTDNSTDVLLGVPDLTLGYRLPGLYQFEIAALFQSTDATVGGQFSVQATIGHTLVAQLDTMVGAAGTSGAFHGQLTPTLNTVVTPSVPFANVPVLVKVKGLLTATGPGELTFKFASEVAGTQVWLLRNSLATMSQLG